MLDLPQLALFAVAALAVVAIPGPSVLYVVARSLGEGRRAGLISALGVASGALVHVGAAAVGLSALLASSAEAYEIVRYAGAAYLVWLGLRRLLGRDRPSRPARLTPPPGQLWRQGFVVEALNPKTALFFLAFLPQFADPARGAVAGQLAVLGAVFVLLGLITDSLWAHGADLAGWRLRRGTRFARAERYVSGSVLVGLGLATAVSGSRRAA